MKRFTRILAALVTSAFALAPASQAALPTHGTIVALNANQSTNWSGYNQGALDKGTLFSSITGDWTVPTATQHTNNRDEFSSAWIGIGGGCPESTCTVPDTSLIQLGTEQDVDASGRASYSAWWELIPAPSVTISGFAVRPGDRMHGSIVEAATGSNVWTMSLQNLTTGQSFSQTVPYSSTHATAEWILETPLIFGTGGAGLSALPNLGTVNFDNATVNGAPAGLNASEEMQLVDSSGHPIATPSAPDAQADGFNDCTWSSSCGAPSGAATGGAKTSKAGKAGKGGHKRR